MSKATTQAPRFFSSRLSTANTSPSMTTMPMSSSSSPMGAGARLMGLPKMALPLSRFSPFPAAFFFAPGAAWRTCFRAAARMASARAKASWGVWLSSWAGALGADWAGCSSPEAGCGPGLGGSGWAGASARQFSFTWLRP